MLNWYESKAIVPSALCQQASTLVTKLQDLLKRSMKTSLMHLCGRTAGPPYRETTFSHWLNNQTLYIIQRRIHELAYPFITIPIYIQERMEIQKESSVI